MVSQMHWWGDEDRTKHASQNETLASRDLNFNHVNVEGHVTLAGRGAKGGGPGGTLGPGWRGGPAHCVPETQLARPCRSQGSQRDHAEKPRRGSRRGRHGSSHLPLSCSARARRTARGRGSPAEPPRRPRILIVYRAAGSRSPCPPSSGSSCRARRFAAPRTLPSARASPRAARERSGPRTHAGRRPEPPRGDASARQRRSEPAPRSPRPAPRACPLTPGPPEVGVARRGLPRPGRRRRRQWQPAPRP